MNTLRVTVCMCVCLCVTELGRSGVGLTIVTHDLCTLQLPPNLEICKDCMRNYGQLQGLESSRTAEPASGHNLGTAGEDLS